MEANCDRLRALDRAVERWQDRTSQIVGAWARDTVSKRDRAVIARSAGREIATWLPGLSAQEIMHLASASAFDVKHHLFNDERLSGVRPVQPLPECVLIWPRPKLVEDPRDDRGAGGGPRLKSRRRG
jgi:hypothetical protein